MNQTSPALNAMPEAKDYLALRYPVLVQELAPEEGGGYMATIPLLGSSTFVADGETAADAIAALDRLRRHLIPILVAKGVKLAEPDDDGIGGLRDFTPERRI